ncbi:MAG: hypothetical protein K2F99_00315, partial [Muribaculaceae bacterium]|nr:hypothetical protein [Muribaculaceae bacterium]
YGEYIKIINQRLHLVEKRRAELRKRRGMPEVSNEAVDAMSDLTDIDFDVVQACDEAIQAQLDAPDSEIFDIIMDEDVEYLYEADSTTGPTEQEKATVLLRDARRAYGPYVRSVPGAPDKDGNPGKPTLKIAGQRSRMDAPKFSNMEMKKANEAIPTFAEADIGFIIDETEEVVTRKVLVGIKVLMHSVPPSDLINDIYNTIQNKRKFLKFVKWYSGEEKSLADLMFGIKEMRDDALNSRTNVGRWTSAFRRRKRLTKMSIPYLVKEYTPNGTVVLTMNEVNFIKDEYGLDIMRPDHVKMIMDNSFLLGFVILDQANELCHITYDGHGGNFQRYTYAMLRRESNMADEMLRTLYRSLG